MESEDVLHEQEVSMTRGKFVVFEGGEGSGKTSCLAWLRGQLDPRQCLFTREPGGTPFSEAVRNVVLKHWEHTTDALEQMLLMETARSYHVRHVIAPALARGQHVLCDRFSASTYAYQVYAEDGDDERVRQLFNAIEFMTTTIGRTSVIPNHWIFLDVEPEEGLARLDGRVAERTVFDDAALEFHRRVREGLKFFLQFRPHTCIDTTTMGEGAVREAVLVKVKEVLLF
jgi:dTMP kinase